MAAEDRNNTVALLIALGLGIMIGKNWPKIKKGLGPMLETIEKQYGNISAATLGTLAGQKERFEDLMATRRYRKGTKKPKAATA